MIVLLRPDPAWEQLLNQAGLPFRVGTPDLETRVVAASAATGPAEIEPALAAAAPGCGLLTEGQPPAPARAAGVRCEVLPFRLDRATRVGRPALRAFGSDAPRPVVERVALRNRGEVRRAVTAAVRKLLEQQGLPCVRLASVPAGSPAVLCFRVDTDYCGREELALTARLSGAVEMPFSWFINTEAHGPLLGELEPFFAGQDVQVHCYRHDVFRSVRANRENIGKAIGILRAHGFHPTGAASPWGDWNPAWDRALTELGLVFSSDFVAGYDDLPFRPLVKGRLSRLLQVPVHPVCLGRLFAAGADKDMIINYFRTVVTRQVNLREPCLLYDHPTALAAHSDLMAVVLSEAVAACGSVVTLGGLADWWQRRERTAWSVALRPDAVEVMVERAEPGIELELESRGRWTRIPLRSGRCLLAGLSWQPALDPGPAASPAVPLRARLSEKLRWLGRQTRP